MLRIKYKGGRCFKSDIIIQGGPPNLTLSDKGGGGVKNPQKRPDVIYGCPLMIMQVFEKNNPPLSTYLHISKLKDQFTTVVCYVFKKRIVSFIKYYFQFFKNAPYKCVTQYTIVLYKTCCTSTKNTYLDIKLNHSTPTTHF